MEPVSVAKAALTAAKILFTTDEEGNTGLQKLVIAICTGLFILFTIFYLAVQIFLVPVNDLAQWFLPESIREARASAGEAFNRPIVATGQSSIMPFPVTINTVSSYYGWRYVPIMGGMNFHEGIDYPVSFGSEVMAIAPGKVVKTGISKDYGFYIMIQHQMIRLDEDGEEIEREIFYSFYAHLYKVYVFDGQQVEQGRQIALSGGDPLKHFCGNSTGAHLHLELRHTQEYASHFDPYDYVLDPDPFDGETKSVEWGAVE